MSQMSQLHAHLTELGEIPEYPDDADWDAPNPDDQRQEWLAGLGAAEHDAFVGPQLPPDPDMPF